MKKFLSIVTVALLATSMSTFVSCGNDDDSLPNNSGNGGGTTVVSDSVQIGVRLSQTGYCSDEEYTQIRSRLATFFRTKLSSILKAGGKVQVNGFSYMTNLTDTARVNQFIRTTLTDKVMKDEFDVDASGVFSAAVTISSYSEKCGEKTVYSYGYDRLLNAVPVGTWSATVEGTTYSLTIKDENTGILMVGNKSYEGTMKHNKADDGDGTYSIVWEFRSNETKHVNSDDSEQSCYIMYIHFCYTTTNSFHTNFHVAIDGGGYDTYEDIIFKK